jgi:hypothetical protein
MNPSEFFAANYAEARRKFRDAARAAGATVETNRNPAAGPADQDLGPDGLTTDVVRLGPNDARRLVVAMSATHGVEGFCGSGIQTGWLRTNLWRELPAGVGLLLIHAINPHGFAWVRRVNEDNVDLNRNFVDHSRPYPRNEGYEQLREVICPRTWDDKTLASGETVLRAYALKHGAMAMQGAISTGQYFDADGVFYGGRGPVWSHRTLLEILGRHGAGAQKVAFIDLHTGLGPHGIGEIINNHNPRAAGFDNIERWFGDEATSSDKGSSSSAIVTGDTTNGLLRALPRADIAGITLEYGTVPLDEVLLSVRADNWLHCHGDPRSDRGRAIKARIRAAFYPDQDDWKRMVFERGADVLARMAEGLAAS